MYKTQRNWENLQKAMFDGVGMFTKPEYKDWLLIGYEEMKKRLEPTKIIWKGKIPDELESDRDLIVQIPSFTDKWN